MAVQDLKVVCWRFGGEKREKGKEGELEAPSSSSLRPTPIIETTVKLVNLFIMPPFIPDDVVREIILALAQLGPSFTGETDFEELRMINSHITVVTQVSKFWSEVALPLLWKYVVVDKDQLQLFLRANQKNPRIAQIAFFHVFGFPDVSDSIYLQERDRALNPWTIVPRLVNLGHLCLPSPGSYLEGIPLADLTKLVSLETHLSDNYAHLTSLLELHHLTFLSLHTNFTSAEPLLDLEGPFPNLTTLHLHALSEWSDNLSQNPYGDPPPILITFSRLLRVAGTQLLHVGLFVGQAQRFQEENQLSFDLHKMCPNLETLSVNHVDVLQGVTPVDAVYPHLHTLLLGHPSIEPGLFPFLPPPGHVTEFRATLSSEEVVASDLALADSLSEFCEPSDFPSLQRIVLRHSLFDKDHRAEKDARLVEQVERMEEWRGRVGRLLIIVGRSGSGRLGTIGFGVASTWYSLDTRWLRVYGG